MRHCPLQLILLFVFSLIPPMSAAQDQSGKFSDEETEFFENKARPILVEHCGKCHGADADPVRAGFSIASRQSIVAGGDTGPAIVPGDANGSLLIEAVNYRGDYEMPPDSKLSDEQIAVLTQWVRDGAAWPEHDESVAAVAEQFDLKARRDSHWCWQPVVHHEPPAVRDADWPLDPIDNFILARLEDGGLTPADDADRRTWLRRVWFDLVGLPPSPSDVGKFLNDDSNDAYANVVDGLLASPHFGERWARHWMDLTRYAETHGHEFDYPIEHAYQYRDYLIRAFNADVPYDDFVREQIAGDLLPEPRQHQTEGYNESIIGTGFWHLGEATHGPVDVKADEAGHVDNQIDVMGKTFLGLTVACARCHDHKFDAISTEDYYAMSGYLQSSRRQIALLDREGAIEAARTRTNQNLVQLDLSMLKENCERIATGSAKNWNDLLSEKVSDRPHRSIDWQKMLSSKRMEDENSPLQLFRLALIDDEATFKTEFEKFAERQGNQRQQYEDFVNNSVTYEDFENGIPADWFVTGWAFESATSRCFSLAGNPIAAGGMASSARLGGKFQGALRSPTFEIDQDQILVRAKGDQTQIRLIIDGYHLDTFNPLLFEGCKVDLANPDRFEWVKLGGDVKNYRGHRAYLEFNDHSDSFCEIDEIRFADAHCPPPSDAPSELTSAILDRSPNDKSEFITAMCSELQQRFKPAKCDAEEFSELLSALLESSVVPDQWLVVRDQINEIPSHFLPEPMKVIAMADGTAEDEHLFIRGNSNTQGDIVPRRFLTALDDDAAEDTGSNLTGDSRMDFKSVPHDDLPEKSITRGSGRLQLADQIANKSNPLTSRVMVNRIWQHLLGQGLVASSDNFGLLGQPPSHPELLDFLASEFCDDGWSVKRMIRRVVLSRTYRMSSTLDPADDKADPDNQLLHRARIKRLQGEAIRDSMLKIADSLDTTMYGPSIPIYLTEFMQGRGRPETSGPLDGAGRRSIYIEVRRNFLSPMMLAFDTPIPLGTIGNRHESNVPAQALTLMNDPFVIEQSHKWAERISVQSKTTADRVEQIFQQAFGRSPSSDERASTEAFLRDQAIEYGLEESDRSDVRLWQDLCHAVFNMKELIFLE